MLLIDNGSFTVGAGATGYHTLKRSNECLCTGQVQIWSTTNVDAGTVAYLYIDDANYNSDSAMPGGSPAAWYIDVWTMPPTDPPISRDNSQIYEPITVKIRVDNTTASPITFHYVFLGKSRPLTLG